MKTILYHGTSADNLPTIKKHGLVIDESPNWNLSESAIYFYSPDELVKAEETDDDTKHQDAFLRASESAQCAIAKSKDVRCVVLKIELPDSFEIEDDVTHNAPAGAVCVRKPIPSKYIKEIHVSNDLTMLKGYFIYTVMSLKYYLGEFTNAEQKIASVFKEAKLYPEDLDELIEFEQIK